MAAVHRTVRSVSLGMCRRSSSVDGQPHVSCRYATRSCRNCFKCRCERLVEQVETPETSAAAQANVVLRRPARNLVNPTYQKRMLLSWWCWSCALSLVGLETVLDFALNSFSVGRRKVFFGFFSVSQIYRERHVMTSSERDTIKNERSPTSQERHTQPHELLTNFSQLAKSVPIGGSVKLQLQPQPLTRDNVACHRSITAQHLTSHRSLRLRSS